MSFPIVNPNAAEIDIGDLLIAVAVPQYRDMQPVREFGAYTEDLFTIASWLRQCRVDSVAMECTGVYWKNLYAVLVEQGFSVCLANSRHTQNVTGRKTDMSDAQRIQQLHSCGFLSSSFLPDDATQILPYTGAPAQGDHRGFHTLHLAYAEGPLELMNIKLHAVISDITGKTGSAILSAILGVDVVAIPEISEIAALEILSETGTDLSKWPSRNHFVSWLNLCPNNKISGGKLISSQMLKKKPNAAASAFRIAANSMYRSKSWLGDYFRRMKAKGGQKYAIVATARKLAIIYYEMVTGGKEYKPLDNLEYKLMNQRRRIAHLEQLLKRLKKEAA